MKSFAVIIAPSVQDQIAEQALFIALDSIENALAWEAVYETRSKTQVTFLGTRSIRMRVIGWVIQYENLPSSVLI